MVFINKYNKDLLPYQLYPLKDEIFSSWLCRLAFKNKVSINAFTKFYLNKGMSFWFGDVDFNISNEISLFLKNGTLLKDSQIDEMFLSSFIGLVYASLGVRKDEQYILKKQQFCPSCFTKTVPYYKKQWRLTTSIMCADCMCYLLSSCPQCNSPVNFHRTNVEIPRLNVKKVDPIHYCSYCSFDLRESQIERAKAFDLEYQKYIDLTLLYGYNSFSQYSFTYFSVLMIITSKLRSNNNRLKVLFNEINEIRKCQVTYTANDIRFWSEKDRRVYLVLAYHLLKNHDLFKQMVLRSKVSKKTFKNTTFDTPFWFERIF